MVTRTSYRRSPLDSTEPLISDRFGNPSALTFELEFVFQSTNSEISVHLIVLLAPAARAMRREPSTQTTLPMLFLQGTEDELADPDHINQVVEELDAVTTVHFVKSAGHGFNVPVRPDQDVHVELAHTIAAWTAELS